MGSRSHPHRVLSVCVCVCVSRCLWVCVIEADSLQLRVITVGLYLFLSRSLLCQILAVFAVVVYGPFWFRDSWALLLPGLRSPDLGFFVTEGSDQGLSHWRREDSVAEREFITGSNTQRETKVELFVGRGGAFRRQKRSFP